MQGRLASFVMLAAAQSISGFMLAGANARQTNTVQRIAAPENITRQRKRALQRQRRKQEAQRFQPRRYK